MSFFFQNLTSFTKFLLPEIFNETKIDNSSGWDSNILHERELQKAFIKFNQSSIN